MSVGLGLALAIGTPIASFFILKHKLGVDNAGAIAAAYGSVSAVTFVTATSFLDYHAESFNGHMIAIMALMEAPAILVGVLIIRYFKSEKEEEFSVKSLIKHAFSNGSVVIILGSLIIGYLASTEQAEGIRPFTTDIFKGFLAVFLLDMGIHSGRHLSAITRNGVFPILFSSITPFIYGLIALGISMQITDSPGNQLLFAILGASASYIAVPAAMKISVPKANPGLYLPMALGITFPINVMIGIPFYYFLIQMAG